ncbi:SIR2 family NAD-dependent protein deacylase [Planococcus beigongshangi]|uniref:SIR2 family NAD-dependent protein deacylase n=1 Tax=Planococcus beigongshangi TaxID=2782536 RepID=UPI00193C15AC|nr:SIR2 family protein [Planococcus beigongshangi]
MNKKLEEDRHFLDIATSMVSGSLTFFIGSGFSKYLTDGNAPSWIELLKKTVDIKDDESLFNTLFYTTKDEKTLESHFDLTVTAQIIQEEYKKRGLNFREEICNIIESSVNENTINQENLETVQQFFLENTPNINIVTTNYDQLLNKFILPNKSRVYVEGAPISKLLETRNLYHIHGSILFPESLVVTQDDYFKFQHKETYISRKFYTLLQETTTVIIGYSLNDFNLNRILNESKYSKHTNLRSSDIYYVSREKVDDKLKIYYFSTFGITVIDNVDLNYFFNELNIKYIDANKIVKSAAKINDIIYGQSKYKDEFLKLNSSLNIILSRITLTGLSFNDEEVQRFLLETLERKKGFTKEDNAWNQYTSLAHWLVEFGASISMSRKDFKEDYLKLVHYSFSKMSEEKYIGYSWEAFQVWRNEWDRLTSENKSLIKEYFTVEDFREYTGVPKFIEEINFSTL